MKTINLSTILSIIQANILGKDLKKNKTLLAYILNHMQENKLSQLGCFLLSDDDQPQPSILALTKQYNILFDLVIILRPRRDLCDRKQEEEGEGDQTANIFEPQPMKTGGHHAIILSCYQLHFTLIRQGLRTRKQPDLSYLNLKSTEKKIVRLCIDRLHNETPAITSHVLYEDFIKNELGKRNDTHKGIYNIDPKTTIMPLQTGQNGIDFFNTVSNRNHHSTVQKKLIYVILQRIVELHLCGFVHRDIKLDNFMIDHHENFGILSAILIDLDTLIPDNQLIEKLTGTRGYMAAETIRKFKPDEGMLATYKDDYFPALLTAALCEPEIGNKARKYLNELHTSLQDLQLRKDDFKGLAKLQEKFEHKLKKLLKKNVFHNPIIRALYTGLTQPNITLLDVLVQLWDDPGLKGYVRNDFCDSKKCSPLATYTHLPKIDKGLFDLFEEIKKIETDYLGRLPFGYEAKFHFNLGHQLSKILVSLQLRRRPVEDYLPTKVEEDFSFAKLNPGTLLQQATELTRNSQELTELYLLFEYIEALCQLEKQVNIEHFDEIKKIFYTSICRGFKLDCYQLLLSMRSEKYNHVSCRQILLESISTTYVLFLDSQLTYNVECPLSDNPHLKKVQNQHHSFFYLQQKKAILPASSLENIKSTHFMPVTRQ